MDINDPTDQEKSVLLARAMNWVIWDIDPEIGTGTFFVPAGQDGDEIAIYDLYDPDLMRFAWQVLNFVADQGETRLGYNFFDWFIDAYPAIEEFMSFPPADAQRLWLDKILELAIEAGLVELGPKWVSDNPDLEARREFEDNQLL